MLWSNEWTNIQDDAVVFANVNGQHGESLFGEQCQQAADARQRFADMARDTSDTLWKQADGLLHRRHVTQHLAERTGGEARIGAGKGNGIAPQRMGDAWQQPIARRGELPGAEFPFGPIGGDHPTPAGSMENRLFINCVMAEAG